MNNISIFKKTTIVAAALLLCNAVQSQTKYTAAVSHEMPAGNIDNGYHCPVRSWDGRRSLACVQTGATACHFYLINHSDFDNTPPTSSSAPTISARKAQFPGPASCTALSINDIYISDYFAFFCGEWAANNTWQAFIGYFDINDFFNGSLNYNVFFLGDMSAAAPATLRKLVAYPDAGSFHVVAIGNDDIEQNHGQCKIVEVHDIFSLPSYCDVADLSVGAYTGNKLYADDIILTDNYVIVLGHDRKVISTVLGYPWYCMGNRLSVVADICDPSLNPNFFLPVVGEANDDVAGVALDGDRFAMAYVHATDTLFLTRLRTIDPIQMDNPHSQQFQKPQKENPSEMVYLRDLGWIEMLQCVYDSSNFVFLDPFAAYDYGGFFYSPDSREYKSLSAIDGARFVSMRSGHIYLQDMNSSFPPSSPVCPQYRKEYVETIEMLPPVQYPIPCQAGTNTLIYQPDIQSTRSARFANDCFSVE